MRQVTQGTYGEFTWSTNGRRMFGRGGQRVEVLALEGLVPP